VSSKHFEVGNRLAIGPSADAPPAPLSRFTCPARHADILCESIDGSVGDQLAAGHLRARGA